MGVAVVNEGLRHMTAVAVKYKESVVPSITRLLLVWRSKTCSSHANSNSLLLQPDIDELTKTSCLYALMSATQVDCSVEFADALMRPCDRAVPSAQTGARTVIYSREPSYEAVFTSFFSY